MGAQFRLTLPRKAGAILETSPLPLVPRDLVGPGGTRLDGLEAPAPLAPSSPVVAATSDSHDASAAAETSGEPIVRRARRPSRGDHDPLLASLLGAAGCVSVPTSGPIEKVEGQQQGCQNCVNVEVAPPAAGRRAEADRRGLPPRDVELPAELLRGQAVPDPDGRREVEPRGRGLDLSGLTDRESAQATVRLKGRLVGSLGPDRTYTAQDQELRVDFGWSKENGEWRINNPPPRTDGCRVLLHLSSTSPTISTSWGTAPRWFPTRSTCLR